MKILLIVPRYNIGNNINYNYHFPLGLGYISSSLKNNGYDVDCLNLNHFKGKIHQIIKNKLDEKRYDVVCSGGIALLYHILKSIVDTVKSHKTKPMIIIGGTIITSEKELMFRSLDPDFAVVGEGDITISELMKYIEVAKITEVYVNYKEIDGIIYKDEYEDIVFTKERKLIKDLDTVPYPDFEGLEFNKLLDNIYCNSNYMYYSLDSPKVYPILGSRGCPFRCTFCWHDTMYRKRSIDNIMNEIDLAVEKYKINYVRLYDDCLSTDKKRLYEFCDKMICLSKKHSIGIRWSCQLLVNMVDKDILKKLHDSGCDIISYGFESYSTIVLKSMKKPITPQQIHNALINTLDAKIAVQANFIFGDIAETMKTAMETLDYWINNSKSQILLTFVQPYPGSELYEYCIDKGLIKDKLEYIKYHMGQDSRINMTSMSNKDFRKLDTILYDAVSKNNKFVIPNIKNINKNVYDIEIECPYCNKKITYRNCFINNTIIYSFHLICRNCRMRFIVTSYLAKIAYKYYSVTRPIRNYGVYLRNKYIDSCK